MQQRSKRKLVAAASAAIASFSLIQFNTSAASFTWNGLGADDNLLTGANWVGGAAPSAVADIAFFTGAPPRVGPIVSAPTQLSGITFDAATAAAFTFGGTSTLTLGAAASSAGSINNNGT